MHSYIHSSKRTKQKNQVLCIRKSILQKNKGKKNSCIQACIFIQKAHKVPCIHICIFQKEQKKSKVHI